ncbi:MAG: cytochrome b N-terminal domain-containing protein [Armatimonadota bacterium]|nr:cytochrome b N-terminal domain-containing protein [Armatimonadota bacterium]MDR7422789.1 cytochrome b N-terminal domain-containing protein [Armatimonadota bacterium]MDR7453351.1 cytochrome b N-terminal domain-containing protein [Armatimonadota bacterium]MDR7457037.1 cytochrome b N-terminal domain-containing protein [Armatimonadota bacterium]MDR7497219.1 cytochrome b N-terminal domain-containing protein [Armatimonadota bacterium]
MSTMLANLQEWYRDRRAKLDLFDETLVDRQANPLFLLGPMLYYFWIVTVVSGVVLMFWYEPTPTGAYNSILRIQHDIPFGWLWRGMHKYAADGLIITIILRIYRMYFLGEYKKPGELSWIWAFAGLVLAMISGITGYLLIWNQRAFWAAKTVLTVPVFFDELTAKIPVIGEQFQVGSMIAYLFLGGPAVGAATLTRFYALHFGISLVLLIVAEVFFFRTRRRRLNMSLFPVLLFTAMLVVTSYVLPAELGRRADPNRTPLPILSDWYFLALYQYVKYTPPLWAGLGPGLLIGFGMLVPFLDRGKGRRPLERPFFFVVGLLALVYFLVFTALIMFNIAVIEREPPLVLLTTILVLSGALVWEVRYRRRQAQAPPAPPPRPARAEAHT